MDLQPQQTTDKWLCSGKDWKWWFEAFFRSNCSAGGWCPGFWKMDYPRSLLHLWWYGMLYPIPNLNPQWNYVCATNNRFVQNHKIFMELSERNPRHAIWKRYQDIAIINFDSANDLWSNCKMKNGGRWV